MTGDPFGTRGVRERVLAGWAASPERFREDANAEEDFALGGYRDRVVVELAQNAADAAARAGVPGRLLLAVREVAGRATLLAANTGAPLDADGVLALATLRASAKRGDGGRAVGRFGVGFTAVLAVTDEPSITGAAGGVRFSAVATRELVGATTGDALAAEVARRSGHVPVLRLPFPHLDGTDGSDGADDAEGPVTDLLRQGYDTVVALPLRDDTAAALADRLLGEVGDALLLGLPALAEVTVAAGGPARTVADVASRWHVLRRDGDLDPALLADRPTEERARTAWSVTWAVPRDPGPEGRAGLPGVVHAPTPSDEPLPWPALLVATLPLDSSRRHVAPGPATDAVLDAAAVAYADLLAARAADPDEPERAVWRLVPTGLAAGAVDGELRERLLRLLPRTPLLTRADGADGADGADRADGADGAGPGAGPVAPRDAVMLEQPAGADGDVVAALAPGLDALVLVPRAAAAVHAQLGVRRLALADVVDQLPLPTADGWSPLLAALSGLAADPLAREALGGLPVPLADGRVVRGARGAVLPGGPEPVADALAVLGVRAVAPAAVRLPAARALLERLGAVQVGPRAALDLPAVRAAVHDLATTLQDGDLDEAYEHAADLDGVPPADRVRAVLTLVAAALDDGARPDELGWLAGLPLPDADGRPAPAGELALPGSPAAAVLEDDAVALVDGSMLDDWGPEVLRAVGVLHGLALLRLPELSLDPDAAAEPADLPDLDGVEDWLDAVAADAAPGARLLDLVAVRDLDAVREDGWPAVLASIAADPDLRAAVLTPARIVDAHAAAAQAAAPPSYTAWWLRRELAPAGGGWADPDAVPAVAALLPPAPALLAGLDGPLRRALGAVTTVDGLHPGAVAAVLAGLADERADLDAATALTVWSALARIAVDGGPDGPDGDLPAPDRLRVLDGAGTRLVDARDAVLIGSPAHLQRPELGRPIVVRGDQEHVEALADLLDVPLSGELVTGEVDEGAHAGEVVPVPEAARALLPGLPSTWCEHGTLLVDGVEVDWWVDDGTVHAATIDGLARGLAWSVGAWPRRSSLERVLADPGSLPAVLVDDAWA